MTQRFDDRCYLTLGGTETYLHFLQGFPLADMCGFRVLDDDEHYTQMEESYLFAIADAAARHGFGLMLDALVWRASRRHMLEAGYGEADVERFNVLGVERALSSVAKWRAERGIGDAHCPTVVAGDVGPCGDGYVAGTLSPEAAYDYHRPQLEALKGAGVDLVTALTLTHAAEAIGIVRAARGVGLDVVISPTVETDGRLPDGSQLGAFVRTVDDATSGAADFFMVNCAHPSHLLPTLGEAERIEADWLSRFRGFRGNASAKSHEELDASPELDRGAPMDFAASVANMRDRFDLRVIGGCCGTDAEHLVRLARAAGEAESDGVEPASGRTAEVAAR